MYEPTDILDLVRLALAEFEHVELEASARRAFRIAGLMGHSDTAWLFRADLRPIGGSAVLRREEVSALFKNWHDSDIRSRTQYLLEIWIEERTPKISSQMAQELQALKDSVLSGSINELGILQRRFEADASSEDVPLRSMLQQRADLNGEILDRIRTRTFAYLCRVEIEMTVSIVTDAIFESHRQRVDSCLTELAPEILEQFSAAYKRVKEGDLESRAQALTSCRRILNAVADIVYPATDEPATDSDGELHELTERNFKNRLWQFLNESSTGRTFIGSLHATLADVGTRIDRLHDLASKAVHGKGTVQEVEWCVVQTYLLAGEVLQLHGETPAMKLRSQQIERN